LIIKKIRRTQQLSLKYIKPSVIARTILGAKKEENLLPKGLTTLIPNDGDAYLAATGTSESIVELQGLLRLLDVPARKITVKTRLLRRPSEGTVAQTLAAFSMTLENNNTELITLFIEEERVDLSITGHINGDSSISWLVLYDLEGEKQKKSYKRRKTNISYLSLTHPELSISSEIKDIQGLVLLPPGDHLEITLVSIK
jgi:hypothetical protein